jgi:hypothetical protein
MKPTNYQEITNNRVQKSREASLMLIGQLLDGNHLELKELREAGRLVEDITRELISREYYKGISGSFE